MQYKVTFKMLSPLAIPAGKPYRPLHLDSILIFSKAQQIGSFDFAPGAPHISIPVKQVGEKYKIYKASAMFINRKKSRLRREAWTSTQSWLDDVSRYTTIQRKVHSGMGIYRQKAGYLLLLETPEIYFYFEGDQYEVARILEPLKSSGLGVRVPAGYGMIGAITITESKNDYTLTGPDGYPSRVIPAEEVKQADPRWNKTFTTYSPPYWQNEVAECYIPPRHQYWPIKSPQEILLEIKGGKEK